MADMSTTAERPIPHRGITRRALLRGAGIIGAAAITAEAASLLGVGRSSVVIPPSTEAPTTLAPIIAPKTPEPTVAPTPEPTAAPTPDAPRFAFWTQEQITKAQNEAAAKGQILLLDTWSEQNAEIEDARSSTNYDILTLKGVGNEKTLSIPYGGIVDRITELASTPTKIIYIKNGKTSISFFVDYSKNNIIVTRGQQVIAGVTPLVEFKNEGALSPRLLFSKTGQMAIADNALLPLKKQDNLLRDSNGLPVRLKAA